jgi:UDP-glucose 4-epimerase
MLSEAQRGDEPREPIRWPTHDPDEVSMVIPTPPQRARENGVSTPSCVAITGLDSFLGRRLAERLLARPDPPRILGIDLRRPLQLEGRVRFHRLDLTDPTAGPQLAEVLSDGRVDALVHLAFRTTPTPDIEYDHELETIGSLHVVHACSAAKVKRLVLGSSTMVYGPRPTNPNFLGEERDLEGHPDAHCVRNRVEAEGLLRDWAPRHPDVDVSVLRHCWVMGPTYTDHVVRYFERGVVPVVLGYDPLLQFIHEDDLLGVFEKATLESHPGVFNVVGRGVLPLSTLLALAGKRALPLPSRLLYRVAHYPSQGQTGDMPSGFFDYLRYLWVADGDRGFREFGEPVYSTKEAWISFVSSRRMHRYR